jgi:hypothetical protein
MASMRSFQVLLLAVLAAFAALPNQAMAGEPTFDPEGGVFPLRFVANGGAASFTSPMELPVTCKKSVFWGEYSTATTGWMIIEFQECSEDQLPSTCTGPGLPLGVMRTQTLTFHTTYVTDAKTSPGILITPPAEGVWATSKCAVGTRYLTGNGVIGQLSAPACGMQSKTFTLGFSAVGTSQQFTKVTGTGTAYSLQGWSPFFGANVGFDSHFSGTFEKPATLTCL